MVMIECSRWWYVCCRPVSRNWALTKLLRWIASSKEGDFNLNWSKEGDFFLLFVTIFLFQVPRQLWVFAMVQKVFWRELRRRGVRCYRSEGWDPSWKVCWDFPNFTWAISLLLLCNEMADNLYDLYILDYWPFFSGRGVSGHGGSSHGSSGGRFVFQIITIMKPSWPPIMTTTIMITTMVIMTTAIMITSMATNHDYHQQAYRGEQQVHHHQEHQLHRGVRRGVQVLEADQHQVVNDDDGDDGDDYPGLEAPSRPSSAYFQLHLHLSALQFTFGSATAFPSA